MTLRVKIESDLAPFLNGLYILTLSKITPFETKIAPFSNVTPLPHLRLAGL